MTGLIDLILRSLGHGLIWLRDHLRFSKKLGRHQSLRCTTCGYDMRATPHRCPECGTAREKHVV